jgi:hypothetical protein
MIDDLTAARREAIRWLPRCTGELFDHGDVLVERHAPEAALCWLARMWYVWGCAGIWVSAGRQALMP